MLICPFDEDLDDYAESFTVLRLPPTARDLLAAKSWAELPGLGEPVGQVAVGDVEFDGTRREAIRDRVFGVLGLAG